MLQGLYQVQHLPSAPRPIDNWSNRTCDQVFDPDPSQIISLALLPSQREQADDLRVVHLDQRADPCKTHGGTIYYQPDEALVSSGKRGRNEGARRGVEVART